MLIKIRHDCTIDLFRRLLGLSGVLALTIVTTVLMNLYSTTALLLFKTFYNHEFDYEKMFILGCYGLAVVCGRPSHVSTANTCVKGGCIVASWAYFAQKLKAIPDRSYLLDINS